MYKYVNDISKLAHDILANNITNFSVAVDATLGNGHDTDFLSEKFNVVYSFEIQENAINTYKKKNKQNVVLINNSHDKLSHFIHEKLDCVIYNLGFLPGGDKTITTSAESTVKSLTQALEMLNSGGIISIAAYVGHEEGKREKEAIFEIIENLPKKEYGVLVHTFANRNSSPILIIIEKNSQ